MFLEISPPLSTSTASGLTPQVSLHTTGRIYLRPRLTTYLSRRRRARGCRDERSEWRHIANAWEERVVASHRGGRRRRRQALRRRGDCEGRRLRLKNKSRSTWRTRCLDVSIWSDTARRQRAVGQWHATLLQDTRPGPAAPRALAMLGSLSCRAGCATPWPPRPSHMV